MKVVLYSLFSIIMILCIAYGVYWVFKSFSYTIFYQGMVQETIREMVDQKYLLK